jgi:hypothetical protein
LGGATGASRTVRKGKGLSEGQRDDFEDLLRGLNTHRPRIRDAMGFAIDNSEAASEIVQVLTEALTLDETPIPIKIARLFLVSDILHNSTAAVRNAHAYRSLYASPSYLLTLRRVLLTSHRHTLTGFRNTCRTCLRASARRFATRLGACRRSS